MQFLLACRLKSIHQLGQGTGLRELDGYEGGKEPAGRVDYYSRHLSTWASRGLAWRYTRARPDSVSTSARIDGGQEGCYHAKVEPRSSPVAPDGSPVVTAKVAGAPVGGQGGSSRAWCPQGSGSCIGLEGSVPSICSSISSGLRRCASRPSPDTLLVFFGFSFCVYPPYPTWVVQPCCCCCRSPMKAHPMGLSGLWAHDIILVAHLQINSSDLQGRRSDGTRSFRPGHCQSR